MCYVFKQHDLDKTDKDCLSPSATSTTPESERQSVCFSPTHTADMVERNILKKKILKLIIPLYSLSQLSKFFKLIELVGLLKIWKLKEVHKHCL